MRIVFVGFYLYLRTMMSRYHQIRLSSIATLRRVNFLTRQNTGFVFLNFVFKNIVVKIDVVEDGLCFTKSTGETLKINETNVSYVCFPFESCEKFHFKVECFLFNFNNNYFLFFPDTYDREFSIEIMETYFKKRIMKKFYF